MKCMKLNRSSTHVHVIESTRQKVTLRDICKMNITGCFIQQLISSESPSSNQDHIALWRSSFMKLALLLRDTEDAYKFGDGTRIFRNAKFEMMCADVANHSKYKLWLWRLLAYECALLSPREAFEYKWNCSSNIHGGLGKNIPNDNLVEICVHVIKKKMREQGANLTYNQ